MPPVRGSIGIEVLALIGFWETWVSTRDENAKDDEAYEESSAKGASYDGAEVVAAWASTCICQCC